MEKNNSGNLLRSKVRESARIKNETLIKKVPFLLMSWGEDEFQLENSDRKLDSHAKGQARLKTKHE